MANRSGPAKCPADKAIIILIQAEADGRHWSGWAELDDRDGGGILIYSQKELLTVSTGRSEHFAQWIDNQILDCGERNRAGYNPLDFATRIQFRQIERIINA